MQNMLDIVYEWCRKWRLEVNCSKTKVMHFRKKNLCRSQYVFRLGETPLNYEDHYKYLGVIFKEHIDFNTYAETLGAAGLVLMDNSRLTKKIFVCYYSNPKVNDWPTQVRRIFKSMGELDIYNNVQVCDISYARNILFNNYAET